MANEITKKIINKVTSDGDVIKNSSSDFYRSTINGLKKYENMEASDSSAAGEYSRSLFGDMNENEETTGQTGYDFYKSVYNPDDKSFTAAYKIVNDSSDKFIEVLNIQENEVGRMFFDKKETYVISIYKFRLPKSQIKILDEDTGFKGFKFIKIPYWLVKEDPLQYKIKRLNKKKRLANKYNYPVDELQDKVDDDVVEYISQTDGDEESIRKIKIQKGKQITKAETKEATGSASSGQYSSPRIWAKSKTKKNWIPSRKTQIPGGKFVEVKKKCQKFPYCNQGDMKALKIFENERLRKIIKKVAEEHQISESVIKNILTHEITSLIKYKK